MYELQFKQRKGGKTNFNPSNTSSTWLDGGGEVQPRDGEEYQPLLLSDVEEDDENDNESDGINTDGAIRMPYQDTPDAPLPISSDYLVEHAPPSFAIPPSMRRVTSKDTSSNDDEDGDNEDGGIPFFAPTARSFFGTPTKSAPA